MSVNFSKGLRFRVGAIAVYVAVTYLAFLGISPLIVQTVLTPIARAGYLSSIDETVLTLSLNALVYILTFAILLAISKYVQKQDWQMISRQFAVAKKLPLKDLWKPVLAYLFYFVAALFVIAIITLIVPGFQGDQKQQVGFDNLGSPYQYILAFIALVVLAPVVEELIFRGYLYSNIRRYSSFPVTALIVSALFGFAHGQWNVGIDVFVLSLVMCYLRENTGSVWAGMIVHGLKNLLAFTVLFIFPIS